MGKYCEILPEECEGQCKWCPNQRPRLNSKKKRKIGQILRDLNTKEL